MPETPTLAEVIRRAMRAAMDELHVAMPGVVKTVNASRGTVDVVPQLRRPVERKDGTFAVEDLPIIPDVPVVYPRAGGFSVKLPINVGDPVQLVFNERDIGVWREQGEPGTPGDNRAHTLAGAVAVPGLFTSDDVPTIPTNLEMGKEGTDAATIEITGSEVRLTKGSTNLIPRVDRLEAELASIASSLAAAQAPAGATGGPLVWVPPTGQYLAPAAGATATDNIKGD